MNDQRTPGKGLRVLVTGGAGYVGSHACKALAAAGHRPVAFDNLSNGHRAAVKWGPLEIGDIGDRASLEAALSRHRPDAIMHFAAFAYVGESVSAPAKYYRNNVSGALTVLEAAREHGIGTFVFSSTCAVYGVPDQVPIDEDAPRRPINPYGRSKVMIEQMLDDFEIAYGMRFACLRYFNAAGADPDGEIGENHEPETHLIPLTLQAAMGRRANVQIFGTDYPTPDGTCIRDYVHVSDLADAHVRALTHLAAGGASIRCNLGTGRGHSVRNVIDMARKVTGRTIAAENSPRRLGDPPALIALPGRASATLGWQPKLSDLETLLSTAWAWTLEPGTAGRS